jgi:C-terminal processing protease CtpA/Prc
MKVDRGKVILLPLLACVLILGVGAASHAKEAGWLGVMLQPLSDEIKEAMELDKDLQGVLISDIIDESPAEEYGLEDGDIIIMIGGDKVITINEAVEAVKSRSPGEEAEIIVLRDGDKKKVVVKLGERGPEPDVKKKIEMFDFKMPGVRHGFFHTEDKQGYLGVRVEEISADLGEYFSVKPREGVLVLEVIDDSPAEDADLKAGDVILKVDGKEITSPDRLVKYIRKSEPGEEVEVTYKRKNRTRTVKVELDEAPGQSMSWIGEGPGKHVCCGKSTCDLKCLQKWLGKGSGGHKCIIKSPGKGMKKIHIPDIDIEIPDIDLDDLEDIEELKDIKVYRLDTEDLKEEMEQLRKEMEKLKKELEKIKK